MPGLAEGYVNFLRNDQARRAEAQMQDYRRAQMMQWTQQANAMQQQQRAQDLAGNALGGLVPPPPGTPAGGPMPPGPGVSSAPQGQIAPPPGAPNPMQAGGASVMAAPQPAPAPLKPYSAIPQPPPTDGAAPQSPQGGASGPATIPPPPQSQGPRASPAGDPRMQAFTFENVTQNLVKQGVSGGDLWRALNELAPRLDANFRQQVAALNQEVAFLRTQETLRHNRAVEENKGRETDRKVEQGDRRLDQGDEKNALAKRVADAKIARAAAGDAVKFDEEDVKYWAGVMQSGGSLPPRLATTPGGKKLVADIMKAVTRSGVAPKEMLSNQAEFMGEKAGQRTLGTRTANIETAATEAGLLSELALKASEQWKRSGLKSLNDVYKAAESRTSSPELRAFVAANTSFINAYARAINPQGVGTVADKEHAREMLEVAFSKGDYAATIAQLQTEIKAAQEAPRKVKDAMRKGFTGKGADAAPAAAYPRATNPTTGAVVIYKDGKWQPEK